MSFGDVLAIAAFILAIAAWTFPNAMSPLRIRFERWRKDSKFTGTKRKLRSVRRSIALLKRSRHPSYRLEYISTLTFYSICFLGISVALIFAVSFDQAIAYQERTREKAMNLSFGVMFLFYALSVFGRISRTSRSYRDNLEKLNQKRKKLIIEIKNAQTN
jgi:Na+/proline symporter